jgi:glycosyltransferase involved in cell wall biosynthesis
VKIGFLLPGNYGLAGPGNGVRHQAEALVRELEKLGHAVTKLDPWQAETAEDFDVVQFFVGGYAHERIEARLHGAGVTVFAPIIDTNAPNWLYRASAALGDIHPKIRTLQGLYRHQALMADGVMVPSRFAHRRVVRGLGIPPDKVRIVLNGIDPSAARGREEDLERFDLPDDFLLFVGAFGNPRKNVRRLIEATRALGYPLVIAGSSGPAEEAQRVRRAAERAGSVHFLGFVSDRERDALYRACRALCLPSIYEGTGLAALEAAAVGTSVVVTERGGPPDYFGEWVDYVDPFDVSSIRNAIVRAWEEEKAPLGLVRQVKEELTWENSARQLLGFYEDLL